jgi:hypothetical protein
LDEPLHEEIRCGGDVEAEETVEVVIGFLLVCVETSAKGSFGKKDCLARPGGCIRTGEVLMGTGDAAPAAGVVEDGRWSEHCKRRWIAATSVDGGGGEDGEGGLEVFEEAVGD